MINNSAAIGFVNSQGGSNNTAAAENGNCSGNIHASNINASSSQLSSVIENLSNNSDIAALSSASLSSSSASASTSLSSSSSSSASASSSLLATCRSHATHKSYPPINSAYWLPSSHPSPYTVPVCPGSSSCPNCSGTNLHAHYNPLHYLAGALWLCPSLVAFKMG
ncbi:uncharacterized protein [Drosophila virilis]|uniref:uncharacterized protein n=1 Tax=Drosophila virilis TaxID=7244 RepID=UPI0013962DA4|nr:putative protein TPRXL [Drosophila virilis]